MGLIRFLLAVSVVIFHSSKPIFGLTLVNGFTAVKLFFIVSGFYMAMILNGKYSSYLSFVINRALKLFPAYWIVLILCVIYSESKITGLSLWWTLYYLMSNILMLGSHFTSVIIEQPGGLTILPFGSIITAQQMTWKHLYIGPVWSLSVEIIFYLLAPFLLTRRWFKYKMLSMLLISILAYLFLSNNKSWFVPWNYNFFAPNLFLFMLGALAWRFYVSATFGGLNNKVAGYFSLALLASYILGYQYLPSQLGLGLLDVTLDPAAIGVILFTLCIPFVFAVLKNNKVDNFFGNLSYPIYISHFFVIFYFPYFKYVHPIIFTILLSLIIEIFVIKSIDRYRIKLVK